jgi:hypothetical protein
MAPMGEEALGRWEPLSLRETVRLFQGSPLRWWITGGLALELHLGRSWRPHGDSDVSVLRHDVSVLPTILAGWDLHLATGGRLSPWAGRALARDGGENNLWCRRGPGEPWCLDVTVGDGDEEAWVYRRAPSLRVAWSEAVLQSPDGIPYLAPELQLLFKSKNVRPKDTADALQVIAELRPTRRDLLREALDPAHPWQAWLT